LALRSFNNIIPDINEKNPPLPSLFYKVVSFVALKRAIGC
jgi:hypothetical protein